MAKPIDRVTWARWEQARQHALLHGKSLPEVLNERSLLVTPDRIRTLQAVELRAAANLLENLTPQQIINAYGGGGNTALDMQRGVVAWLRQRADLREGDG